LKKLIGILLLLAITVIAGCSKEPTPEQRFSDYIALWNQQKFTKMYDYLSSDAKKNITKEQFTTRYEKLYDDLQIKDLKIDFKKPKKDQADKKPVQYSFTASMNSIAGPIKFSQQARLQEEKRDNNKNWYVDWNPEFIFKGLKEGDKISVSTVAPSAGRFLTATAPGWQ